MKAMERGYDVYHTLRQTRRFRFWRSVPGGCFLG